MLSWRDLGTTVNGGDELPQEREYKREKLRPKPQGLWGWMHYPGRNLRTREQVGGGQVGGENITSTETCVVPGFYVLWWLGTGELFWSVGMKAQFQGQRNGVKRP